MRPLFLLTTLPIAALFVSCVPNTNTSQVATTVPTATAPQVTYPQAPSYANTTPTTSVYTPPAVSTPAVAPAASTVGEIYTIQGGDTLYGISRKYGTSVSAIKSLNNLSSDLIIPGQQIRVR